MDQFSKIEIFRHEATHRLPGILYSFNIADLKRRNAHLGFRAGDKDIEDLDRLLKAMESNSVLVARTQSNRWLALTARDENDRIQALLDRYKKTELVAACWEIRAVKSGQEKLCRESVSAEIKRAVRCLYAPVTALDDLKTSIQRLADDDYGLPVNRPLALCEIASVVRENWQCMSRYGEHSPECPFCGCEEFRWEEHDNSVHCADGACEGCGARIAIFDRSPASGTSSLSYA